MWGNRLATAQLDQAKSRKWRLQPLRQDSNSGSSAKEKFHKCLGVFEGK
jgi:hypothetical protein